MIQVPSIQQTLVGSMLRQFRETHGYKLDDAARILECDRSKISRIETGQRGIRPKELRELLSEYDVDATTQDTLVTIARSHSASGWRKEYRRVLSDTYLDFIATESVASVISVYAPLQIPELLWTPDYGLAVAAADPTVPEGTENAVVEAAVEYRAATLFDRQPDCTIILGEAALRQQVDSPTILRAQLAHVAELSGPDYPWLTIRVLPFSVGAPAAGGSGAWSVLQFRGLPDLSVVHVSGPSGGICLSEPSATTAYAKVFAHTSWFSLNPEQSAQRLRQFARR
jgi:transcriptional regulator with XRE-family HTH domain